MGLIEAVRYLMFHVIYSCFCVYVFICLVKSGSTQHGSLLPDKRELVRLDLDRLHIEIVRAKSLVEVTEHESSKDRTGGATNIEFSGENSNSLVLIHIDYIK